MDTYIVVGLVVVAVLGFFYIKRRAKDATQVPGTAGGGGVKEKN